MNERIKKLIDQMNKSGLLYQAGDYEMTVTGSDLEYFAELIVQECLEACSRANEIRHFVPPGQQQVVLDCMREIEETFRS